MDIEYRTLEQTDDEMIYKAFLRAFEDYFVPLNFSFERFLLDSRRRGLSKELSIGAFLEGELIGFVENGQRIRNGRLTAYDMGTAVFKEYRGQGITKKMLSLLEPLFQEHGISDYLLEVIRENTSAFELYKKQGFRIIRSFDCLNAALKDLKTGISYPVSQTQEPSWRDYEMTFEQEPCWQCSFDSARAIEKHLSFLEVREGGEFLGYAIFDPLTGEIVQIGTLPSKRRQGVASSLLHSMKELTRKDALRILNVDAQNHSLLACLRSAGFTDGVGQYEMIKEV